MCAWPGGAPQYPEHRIRKHDGLRVNLHLQYMYPASPKGRVRCFLTMEPVSTCGIPSSGPSFHDAQKRAPPSLSDCTNVFVVTPSSEQALCRIPATLVVDPFRQKRPHHKSKRGCLQCRKRRVKVGPSSIGFQTPPLISTLVCEC